MVAINQDEITDVISKLDDLLYEGYLLRTHSVDHWIEAGKLVIKPDTSEYKAKFSKDIFEWMNRVATLLIDSFDEKRLYFHFVQPKTTPAMSYDHPLGALSDSLANRLFALEEVILRLEERQSLTTRREIAEKEHNADILYEIKYSNHTREIKLNNIVIHTNDFDSENDNCFAYIFRNPNRPIPVKEIEQANGGSLSKRVSHIVRDLGFTGNMQKIFFPAQTKEVVMFVNPISKQFFQENDLPVLNFKKIVS